MFHCPRFAEERLQLNESCRVEVGRLNLVQVMLQHTDSWEAAATTMRLILTKLHQKWKQDQQLGDI